MPKEIEAVVTFLEMTERHPHAHPVLPPVPTAVLRAEHPPAHFYRYLYDQVGREFNWVLRRKMSDEALEKLLHSDDVALYVLYVEGVPMGMAELDYSAMPDAQLSYFGIMKEARGRGLGAYFLHHVIDIAWSHGPERLLVNTCTLDHPRALPLYQRMGFEVYDQKTEFIEALEE
ncbi:MAG: GNAT family N-acetyltransferase [Alphaproteobacteria bacterium]